MADYEVILKQYDPLWRTEYQQEKDRIAAVLREKILDIQHIGSTSVEGLDAKPIIDIAVAVKHLVIAEDCAAPLRAIGYEYVHKPEFPSRRFFRKGTWRKGTHHLHMYDLHSADWQNNLLFRDYLQNHPRVLQQYCKLKQALAAQHPADRTAYTLAKAPFIANVIELAREETRRQ
ncbi:GrpB family protein [Paenibacillus xerothermodurans]|uniref:GrpB family protein n=1 Tax=Paenibacillus xerothermodurans TaxID=1977292 RepID=A0A2W1P1K7_PAEXE|nr:GrpB family protein [Paenibacillus xerothermodurans]PZE21632.1 GrpB family protein [Paenibacillus xerothermodurans]